MIHISDTIGPWVPFFKTILKNLEELGLPTQLKCDHICYRVETLKRYEQMKLELSPFGIFFQEKKINHRMISVLKLHRPLECSGHHIDCIELPAPKKNNRHIEGLEHAKFIYHHISKMTSLYPHIEFDLSGSSRKKNQELTLQMSEHSRVKFHPLSIQDIIKIDSASQDE